MGVAGHEDGDTTLYSQVHSKYGNSTLWVHGNYRILAEHYKCILSPTNKIHDGTHNSCERAARGGGGVRMYGTPGVFNNFLWVHPNLPSLKI